MDIYSCETLLRLCTRVDVQVAPIPMACWSATSFGAMPILLEDSRTKGAALPSARSSAVSVLILGLLEDFPTPGSQKPNTK
jgi:hypothetical protein